MHPRLSTILRRVAQCSGTVTVALLASNAHALSGLSGSGFCDINFTVPSASGVVSCGSDNGIITPDFISFKESIELGGRVATASYSAIAQYGHLGLMTSAYAGHGVTRFGDGISVSVNAGLAFNDTVTVTSDKLQVGDYVDVKVNYSIDGSTASNYRVDYYGESAYSDLRGYVLIDNEAYGAVPPFYSQFCLFATGSECKVLPIVLPENPLDFLIVHNEVVQLQVGRTYRLNSFINLSSVVSLDLRGGCFNDLCSASSSVASSNSFFTYLTAQSDDYRIVAESGHNYALAAVPEPSTFVILLIGLSALCAKSSVSHRLRAQCIFESV